MNNIAVFGSSGTIGNAMIHKLSRLYPKANIYAFSKSECKDKTKRVKYKTLDYLDEVILAYTVSNMDFKFDLIFVATGVLHTDSISPEKSLKQISVNKFEQIFLANTITPALIAKHFIPKLNTKSESIFAAISAKVGSISDNKLGGWYAYRASKAALNMFIKTASIEAQRINNKSIVISVHPGTVNSKLSKPYQRNIPKGKLFTPEHTAKNLIHVIQKVRPYDTGKCFAWDSKEIKA